MFICRFLADRVKCGGCCVVVVGGSTGVSFAVVGGASDAMSGVCMVLWAGLKMLWAWH